MADPSLAVLSRLMDVAVLRQQVHAGNLANANTPGFKSRSVAFEDMFNEALDGQGVDQAMAVSPRIVTAHATPSDPDGNDVSSEREVAALAKNKLLFDTYTQLARGKMRLLSTAITPAPGG